MPSPQCSCAFYYKTYARLLLYSSCCTSCGLVIYAVFSSSALLNFCCYAFCGITICTTFSPFISLLFFSYNGHSLHLCPFFLHLKHLTTITSCLLIILSSNPYCITLLLNTLNLFQEVVPFSSFCLFLQLQTRCSNFLQLLYSFLFLSSSSSLSLARVHFSLSRLLNNELYCCKDMMLCLYRGYKFNVDSCQLNYVYWSTRSLPSQSSTVLLTTTLIVLCLSPNGWDL